MVSQRRTLLSAALLSLFVITGSPCEAQDTANSAAVNGQASVRLEQTRHPLANPANAMGRVESGRALGRMLLVLKPTAEQEAKLSKFLEEQQNPRSPNYHHWLTATEFGTRFGPADADVQRVCAWLERGGFTIGEVAASKRWVEINGTMEQVEAAFRTQMEYYEVGGKTYLANATNLAVPAELAYVTRGVVSLNNFGRRAPIQAATGGANTYNLTPADFAAIYNAKALLDSGIDGSGVAIAVAGQSQIALAEVRQFRKQSGLKPNDPNVLVSGADPGVGTGQDREAALLDVEWAGAVAPGATIDLVVAGSTDTTSGVDLAAAYAVENRVAPILVYTYGSCERALGSAGNAFYNALWKQAAAEGITVLVAAGDNGAAGCDEPNVGRPAAMGAAVNGVASTPYNVAVGGTQFIAGACPATYWNSVPGADDSSAAGYLPEAAWNESCDPTQPANATNCALGNTNSGVLAGAGGSSSVYAKPAWQSGEGVPVDGARDLPDVALAAPGGTSVATSAMAGILALVEQKNGAFQGQVNQMLYRLAQTPGGTCDSSQQINPTAADSCVFYDVTSGSNSVPCAGGSPGCFSTQRGVNGVLQGTVAGQGYDLVTGLGSVNAANLAAAWPTGTSAAGKLATGSFSLNVSPTDIVFAAGSPGSGTVTVTPSGGFVGTVSLMCGTGGTFVPAGYSCTFGSSDVVVSGTSAVTTALNFTVTATATSGVKRASVVEETGALWAAAIGAGLLLIGLLGMVPGGTPGRNFVRICGLMLGVLSAVSACGGGSGGGQVSTTTTLASSDLHVGYGTPVTLTVTVMPNGSVTPTGQVLLFDNGQALGAPTTVNGGIASFLAASLQVGVHVITAQYNGDANTKASTSAPVTELVAGTVPLQITGTSGGVSQTASFSVIVN